MRVRVAFWVTPKPVLRAALAEHAPEVRLSGLAAGFHAVAHLPSGADEQEVVDAARARRVGLYGMGAFRTARTAAPPRLVLGFGDVTERAIAEGIAAVGPVLTGSA
ncbi:hypothetical protein [Streptomyces capoamus]|uniref:hypothetical protein n=1 Tax=Streptomyces capoamus TaxID=68183 RepID=UPI0033973A8F